jgi:hypothetical protein
LLSTDLWFDLNWWIITLHAVVSCKRTRWRQKDDKLSDPYVTYVIYVTYLTYFTFVTYISCVTYLLCEHCMILYQCAEHPCAWYAAHFLHVIRIFLPGDTWLNCSKIWRICRIYWIREIYAKLDMPLDRKGGGSTPTLEHEIKTTYFTYFTYFIYSANKKNCYIYHIYHIFCIYISQFFLLMFFTVLFGQLYFPLPYSCTRVQECLLQHKKLLIHATQTTSFSCVQWASWWRVKTWSPQDQGHTKQRASDGS